MTDTEASSASVLVIDDDPAFNRVLARALSQRGFETHSATDADMALALARTHMPEFIVLDLNLGGVSGLRLIRPLLEASPDTRILVLTGYASIATAVDAVKLGATQYLAKPADLDAIIHALRADEVNPDNKPGEAPMSAMSVDRLEWEHLQRVLAEHGGNISATARALRMHRRTLQRKLARPPAAD